MVSGPHTFFDLRAASGRIVCRYDNEARARQELDESKAKGVTLRLFKITATEEEILD